MKNYKQKILGALSLLLVSSYAYADNNRFFVNTNILNIRSQPNVDSFILGYYDLSRTDTIKTISDSWVETPKGFVKREFVTLFKKIEDLNIQGVVTANSLMVRANPGTSSVVMYGYKKGEVVNAIALFTNDKDELWIKTENGFVSAQYIQFDKVIDSKSEEVSQEISTSEVVEEKISSKNEAIVELKEQEAIQDIPEKKEKTTVLNLETSEVRAQENAKESQIPKVEIKESSYSKKVEEYTPLKG